jgi:hypothetical protein
MGGSDHQHDGFWLGQDPGQAGGVVDLRLVARLFKQADDVICDIFGGPSMEPTTRLSLAMEWILMFEKEVKRGILPPKHVDKYG